MNNHVEILRAILYTKKDYDLITNIAEIEAAVNHKFNVKKEIPLMVEFKKIYELGTDQLKTFIELLHKEGPANENGEEVDEYTIIYYMEVLLNGPLGSYVRDLTKDKLRYWPNTPDVLGNNGNKISSTTNITMYENVGYPLGGSVDTYNRLPGFMQTTITDSNKLVEDIFRGGMLSTTQHDNTLPMVDKSQQLRYGQEPQGEWVKKPHGTMMVKDSYFRLVIDSISQQIFDLVKEHLKDEEGKDETWRIYKTKKQYVAFDSAENESKSNILKVKKSFVANAVDGDTTYLERLLDKDIEHVEITLDVMGDEFDSFERRATVLKVSNPIKDEEFKLNTNEGQLGN